MSEIDGPEVPDEESLSFEAQAVVAVTAAVETLVNRVLSSILLTYDLVTAQGEPTLDMIRQLRASIVAALREIVWPPMAPALQEVAVLARELGETRAWRSIEWDSHFGTADPLAPAPAVPNADARLAGTLHEAAALAGLLPLTRKADVLAVIGRARQGIVYAKGAARYTANEGINAGTSSVAFLMNLNLIWVAEREACLHCLAYAGYVVAPGSNFPAGMTFDTKPSRTDAIPYPPLHPNCRCQVRTYDGPAGAPDADRSRLDPAARLAAEARRTVAYQWSEYASGPAAMRAADKLLRAGADLPASVEQRARRALRKDQPVRRPARGGR